MQLSWNGNSQNPAHYAWLWWNNQWNLLDIFTIGQAYATGKVDLHYESHSYDSTHLTLPNTQVEGTLLQYCASQPCQWVNWDASNSAIGLNTWLNNDPPYHAHFQSQYYKWYGHSH
jgi:hypothetical protein